MKNNKLALAALAVMAATMCAYADPHDEVAFLTTFITDNWTTIKTAVYTLMLGGLILALIRKHGKRV